MTGSHAVDDSIMVRLMLWSEGMIRLWRHHAPSLLIAASIGWGVAALLFGMLADAGAGSILWASFERLFALFAVAACSLALWIMARRSWMLDRFNPLKLKRIVPWVAGAMVLLTAAWWETAAGTQVTHGLLMLGFAAGALISFDRLLPPGGDEARV